MGPSRKQPRPRRSLSGSLNPFTVSSRNSHRPLGTSSSPTCLTGSLAVRHPTPVTLPVPSSRIIADSSPCIISSSFASTSANFSVPKLVYSSSTHPYPPSKSSAQILRVAQHDVTDLHERSSSSYSKESSGLSASKVTPPLYDLRYTASCDEPPNCLPVAKLPSCSTQSCATSLSRHLSLGKGASHSNSALSKSSQSGVASLPFPPSSHHQTARRIGTVPSPSRSPLLYPSLPPPILPRLRSSTLLPQSRANRFAPYDRHSSCPGRRPEPCVLCLPDHTVAYLSSSRRPHQPYDISSGSAILSPSLSPQNLSGDISSGSGSLALPSVSQNLWGDTSSGYGISTPTTPTNFRARDLLRKPDEVGSLYQSITTLECLPSSESVGALLATEQGNLTGREISCHERHLSMESSSGRSFSRIFLHPESKTHSFLPDSQSLPLTSHVKRLSSIFDAEACLEISSSPSLSCTPNSTSLSCTPNSQPLIAHTHAALPGSHWDDPPLFPASTVPSVPGLSILKPQLGFGQAKALPPHKKKVTFGICADGWSSCSSTSSSPPPLPLADDSPPPSVMSPNDGTGRPARHTHTRLSAHHEGGGLKEHPPEMTTSVIPQPVTLTQTTTLSTTSSGSRSTPRKRPLEPRSPQSSSHLHHARRSKTLRGTSPSPLSVASPGGTMNGNLIVAPTSAVSMSNGGVGMHHPRERLMTKNGVTVRRANGLTDARLTNGHVTPESLQFAFDAKLATMDAKINCHDVSGKVNGFDGNIINGLNGVRLPELRTRNSSASSHDANRNVTDVRQNGFDHQRLNGFTDHKLNSLTTPDPRRVLEARHNGLQASRQVMDDRILGSSEVISQVAKEAPMSESRLPNSEPRLNGETRHSPRHSLPNGLCHSKPHFISNNNNNSNKTSLNTNNNNKNGFIQPPLFINPNQKHESLSNIRRPADLPLMNTSPRHNLRQTLPPTSNNSIDHHRPLSIPSSSSSRVPIHPCPSMGSSISSATTPLLNNRHLAALSLPISVGSCSLNSIRSCNSAALVSTGCTTTTTSRTVEANSGVSSDSSSSGFFSGSSILPHHHSSGGSRTTSVPYLSSSSSGPSSGNSSGQSSGTTTPTTLCSILRPPTSVGLASLLSSSTGRTFLGSKPTSASSVPTVVRFPVAPTKKDTPEVCKWKDCNKPMEPSMSLLEHIQAIHVEGQLSCESFCCLWVGCKVFERSSCSVSWLERHVLTHGGHKPFKCIVEGCGHRFTSQTALERHVNHHFNNSHSSGGHHHNHPHHPHHSHHSGSAGAATTAGSGVGAGGAGGVGTASCAPLRPLHHHQNSPSKLIRKHGRRLRFRRRPWSARMFDFFDVSIMERLQWGLVCVNKATMATAPNVVSTPRSTRRKSPVKGVCKASPQKTAEEASDKEGESATASGAKTSKSSVGVEEDVPALPSTESGVAAHGITTRSHNKNNAGDGLSVECAPVLSTRTRRAAAIASGAATTSGSGESNLSPSTSTTTSIATRSSATGAGHPSPLTPSGYPKGCGGTSKVNGVVQLSASDSKHSPGGVSSSTGAKSCDPSTTLTSQPHASPHRQAPSSTISTTPRSSRPRAVPPQPQCPSDQHGGPYQSDCITLYPTVLGRRVTELGRAEEMVTWTPCDVIPDGWVSAGAGPLTLPLTALSPSGRQTVARLCYPRLQLQPTAGASRRKRPAHARQVVASPSSLATILARQVFSPDLHRQNAVVSDLFGVTGLDKDATHLPAVNGFVKPTAGIFGKILDGQCKMEKEEHVMIAQQQQHQDSKPLLLGNKFDVGGKLRLTERKVSAVLMSGGSSSGSTIVDDLKNRAEPVSEKPFLMPYAVK